MIRKNQPQSPATALGHITIARSGIRSSQPKTSDSKASATRRSKSTGLHSPLSQPTRKRKRAPGPPASTQSLPAYGLPAPVELDTPAQSQQSQPADTTERLSHYQPSELPTTTLQTRLLPPSELRDSSMFSDLTGRFPATAMDGSQ